MIVVATGPRSNGTSILYRIVCTGAGKTPLHLPAYPVEFRDQDWATDFPTALFVVVVRDREIVAQSMADRHDRGEPTFPATFDAALAEQDEALRHLGRLHLRAPGRVFWLRYEELVRDHRTVIASIDAWLRGHGYAGTPLFAPEPIVDGNAKYREAAA